MNISQNPPSATTKNIAQIALRIALGIGYILPVLDRLGLIGLPGATGVGWGNWENFCAYTHLLMPYLSLGIASFFGLIATITEVALAIMLLSGYKVRIAAYGSFVLTLLFALSMLIFLGYRAPFNYSVFVVSFASLLLAAQNR